MKDSAPEENVYTFLVQTGRNEDDGLPVAASGAAMMCFAPGFDQSETAKHVFTAVKDAGFAVREVAGFGTLPEREAEGHPITERDRELMIMARDEMKVVIAQMKPVFDV